MFVISIVSAAVPPANPFPPTLLRLRPVPEALRPPARPAGSANASPDSVLRHRLRKAFPALRRNTVQSYAIAPNKQSASAKFRTRNRVPSRRSRRRSPAPRRYSPGKIAPPLRQPGKTELSRRPCRDSALALLRAAEHYAAIRQPVPRAYSGHQRSRRAVSSAPQSSNYDTTWLTT